MPSTPSALHEAHEEKSLEERDSDSGADLPDSLDASEAESTLSANVVSSALPKPSMDNDEKPTTDANTEHDDLTDGRNENINKSHEGLADAKNIAVEANVSHVGDQAQITTEIISQRSAAIEITIDCEKTIEQTQTAMGSSSNAEGVNQEFDLAKSDRTAEIQASEHDDPVYFEEKANTSNAEQLLSSDAKSTDNNPEEENYQLLTKNQVLEKACVSETATSYSSNHCETETVIDIRMDELLENQEKTNPVTPLGVGAPEAISSQEVTECDDNEVRTFNEPIFSAEHIPMIDEEEVESQPITESRCISIASVNAESPQEFASQIRPRSSSVLNTIVEEDRQNDSSNVPTPVTPEVIITITTADEVDSRTDSTGCPQQISAAIDSNESPSTLEETVISVDVVQEASIPPDRVSQAGRSASTAASESALSESPSSSPPMKPNRSAVDFRSTTPVAPPRRPSSMVHIKKLSSSSFSGSTYSTGKLFNTLPRHTPPPYREVGNKRKEKRGMLRWLGGDNSKKKNKEVLETVSEGLRKIYKQKLYPLEEHYKFHEFHSPALDDPDFDAKPMILLVGQYSTGKTTFIRHLLEKDFPGIRIGPEPTTDRFIAVMYGEEEGVIPGNALVVDAKKQFRALSGFGNAFLNRFQCSTLANQVLESVTIVDTPGILSGEKQRIDRGYDFTGVLEWFAERVDRIILLFDAHKLDISDEFKRCIEALAGNEDKIRIVLNKSDMVDHQQLMRVYGALMWSLGKVFRTPEVSRVYIGTFWDHPLHYDINRRLFQDEQHDLFQDLQALPRNAALRKLNDLIKRARLAKVHAFIISELRKQMPSMIGKEKKKKELIQNLDKIFEQIQREHNISPGDFPDVQKMREKLQNQDFTKFNALKPKLLDVVDGMLATDIARLMSQIPKEEMAGNQTEQPSVRGGAFTQAQEAETPFGFGRGEGFDKGADESEWVVSRERTTADSTFESLGPVNGYLSGRTAKEHMVKSKLPNAVLGKIWKLADVDKDGQLDADEFALANYLINLKLEGHELPTELPNHLVPPSKRNQEPVYPTLDESDE